jgi:hypothetical protein
MDEHGSAAPNFQNHNRGSAIVNRYFCGDSFSMGDFGVMGEWKVKHSESKDAWNIIGTTLGSRYKIARLPYFKYPDLGHDFNDREKREQRLNAQLISCAPEMLEMLQDIANTLENGDTPHVYQIRDLITKATTI